MSPSIKITRKPSNNFLLFLSIIISLFFFSASAAAGTGIIEVYSKPAGAKVYLDGTYVGRTPYTNPEVSTGHHKIKVLLNKDYPPQYWELDLDDVVPQTKTFIFKQEKSGQFMGIEEKVQTDSHKGNVQFASIPSGALLYINGERIKKTPVGYKDVGVGRYDVKFELNGKVIKGNFDIVRNETIKLIADFNSNKLINRYRELQTSARQEKLRKQAEEQARLKSERQKKERAEKERQRRSPKTLFSGSLYKGARTLAYGDDIIIPLDSAMISKYKLPLNTLTISLRRLDWSKTGSVWSRHYALRIYTWVKYGDFQTERITGTVASHGLDRFRTLEGSIYIPSKGRIKYNLLFERKSAIYDKKGTNYDIEPDSLNGTVTFIPD